MSHEESAALGGIRADIAELRSGQQHLTSAVADFVRASKEQIGETRSEVRDLARSVAERSQFRWGTAISMLVGVLTVLGFGGYILRLQNENAAIPTNTAVVQITETVRQLAQGVERNNAKLDAGKDARLTSERDQAVKNAIQDERIAEMYFKLNGRYPRN